MTTSRIEEMVEETYKALVLAKNNEAKIADEVSKKDELYSPYTRQMIITAMSYLDKIQIDLTQAKQAGIDETVENKEWYLGKKIKAFGKEYIVVGISQMIYDEDCEGEPEWKITKEVQEVAIAEDFDGDYSFQKPSWHTIEALQVKK